MPPKPPLPPELAAFIQSGISVTVAVRDADLRPDGARAWAVQVHEDGTHLTVFLYAKTAPALLAKLEAHPEIALDIDAPMTHRACQLKGLFTGSRRAKAGERALVERQVEGFLTELETIGIPRALTAGWLYWPCVAFEVRVSEVFEQTPGPGAGEPLR